MFWSGGGYKRGWGATQHLVTSGWRPHSVYPTVFGERKQVIVSFFLTTPFRVPGSWPQSASISDDNSLLPYKKIGLIIVTKCNEFWSFI